MEKKPEVLLCSEEDLGGGATLIRCLNCSSVTGVEKGGNFMLRGLDEAGFRPWEWVAMEGTPSDSIQVSARSRFYDTFVSVKYTKYRKVQKGSHVYD